MSTAASNNLGKDGQDQRICEVLENSDNSEIFLISGKVYTVLTIYKDDRTIYQERKEITGKALLESPSENVPIFSAAIKGFLTLTM